MKTIGLIDSGLGGKIILHALRSAFPGENFILQTDPSHMPYGEKSRSFLHGRVQVLSKILQKKGAQEIFLACNSLSCDILNSASGRSFIPMHGIIEPTLSYIRNHEYKKPLILATPRTCSSGAYNPHATLPFKSLAKIIESLKTEQTQQHLHNVVVPKIQKALSDEKYDAIVLACTHYEAIAPELESAFPSIPVVRQSEVAVEHFGRIFD